MWKIVELAAVVVGAAIGLVIGALELYLFNLSARRMIEREYRSYIQQ